ncbi:MAG: hypothetical protein UV60_C0023G0007 [Parcubacteria group bacterium GW2011_GWA2_43_11]|nr:MAG: hypothetical protein UV60_C0023G0007 [Parcubacteria group bacterium GW2011_GWA2_43_11]
MNKYSTFAFRLPSQTLVLVTIVALLAWTFGLPSWIHKVEAANVISFSDTLSDSDLGVDAAHRIKFTTPNGISSSGTFVLDFDSTGDLFDFTGFTSGNVYIVAGGTKVADVGSCGAPTNEMYVTVTASDTLTFTLCAGHTIASSTTFIIDVGTTTAGALLNNPPTASSYVIGLTGTGNMVDSGDTRIAVIDDVTVTAAVNTIFTFSINGVGKDVTVNDDPQATIGTSTATTVPFGIIPVDDDQLMAQELRVDTNALNGFSVSVFANQTLTSGNGATIDEFVNGNAISSSTLWAGPAETLGNTDTYGHWGLTSDDNVVSSTTPSLWGNAQAAYVGNFINNPVEVFYHNTAVTTAQGGMGVGSTTVAYKVEIGVLQEAAKDYTATLTYIATPVF